MKTELKGAGILAGVGIFYSLYGVFSKLMGDAFAPFYQSWSRGIICFLLLTLITILFRQYKHIKRRDIKWFLIIGICGGMTDAVFFIAVTHISLGVTLFLFYACVTLMNYIFGKVLFGEKITLLKKVSAISAVVGVALLYQDKLSFVGATPLYLFCAGLAGVFAGTYYSFNKKVGDSYSNYQVAATNNFIGVIVTFIISMILTEPMNTAFMSFPWFINIVFAIVQTVVMALLILGFRFIEVQKGGLILLLEPILAMVWGYVLFKESLGIVTIIGCMSVLVAMVLPLFEKPERAY